MYRFAVSFLFLLGSALAAEADALAVSATIQNRHLPFGTILDPFLDPNGTVTGYTRCGDSAIWTGHYLAAESFRYQVTRDPEALRNALGAITGIRTLIEVTGNNSLARCIVPKDSPFATGILQEESHHKSGEGNCLGQPCMWVGNTSRDQYVGVFFGLAVAWELIDDPGVRNTAKDLITRLLDRLLDDDWAIKGPDGDTSTVFWFRQLFQGGLAIGSTCGAQKAAWPHAHSHFRGGTGARRRSALAGQRFGAPDDAGIQRCVSCAVLGLCGRRHSRLRRLL